MWIDPIEPEEREANLPQWAQGKLSWLRQKLHEEKLAHQEALLVSEGQDSDTVVSRATRPDIGLGNGTLIEFRGDKGNFTVNIDNGVLYASGTDRDLMILPSVVNAIRLELR